MSAAVVVVILLLLCCFSSSDSEDVCDQYAAVGGDAIIPLKHKRTGSDNLKWMKDSEVILYWRNGKYVTKKSGDIDKDGSLKLTNVTKADAASYRPEVYRSDGTSPGVLPSTRLCVLEPVQKPQVKVTCKGTKNEPKAEFTCTPAQKNTTVKFEWLQKDTVVGKTPTLKVDASKPGTEAVTCKVSNQVSFAISDSVTHNCYKSGIIPEKLFGIDIWIIVGGGAGIVLLLIILVIICCLRARRTKRMRLKDEEELRLEFSRPEQHPQYSHPADRHQQHQHRHHHHHQHHQQPAGHTGPRQHRSKQHRNQPLPRTPDQANGAPQPSPRRAAQPPKPANDEQPPPLPQPRKKAPRKV